MEKPMVEHAWYPGRLDCIALAGDVVTGTLLAQIVFWSLPDATGKPKGGILCREDGHRYIAKTRVQWMAETGLTLKQYKRAITILKNKGIVEVRRMQFQRLTQTHVRLCLDRIRATEIPDRPSKVLHGPEQWSPKDRTRVQRVQTERDNKEVFCVNARATESDLEVIAGGKGETIREEQKTVKTVETEREKDLATDELAIPEPVTLSPKKTGIFMKAEDALKAHKAVVEGTLASFWKSRCTLVLEGYQKALTAKETGQLKILSKKLGDDGIAVRPVITYAIEHWWQFASTAGFRAGHGQWPETPHTGYLLAHYHVAVELLQKSQLQAMTPPLSPEVTPPMQLVAPDEPVHQMTPEEFIQFMADLQPPEGNKSP
jgi:hypothetical protein